MIIIDIFGAEVQAALDTAIAESNDLPFADIAYDKAQAAVAALRPKADSLIKAVRAAVLFATYDMDPPASGGSCATMARSTAISRARRWMREIRRPFWRMGFRLFVIGYWGLGAGG